MSTPRPRSIGKIIEQVGNFGPESLPAKVRQLAAVERQVRTCLADDVAGHCRVGGVVDGSLRLVTESPAWAARLRFQSPALLRQLGRQCGMALRQITVLVSPSASPSPPAQRSIRLSSENARLLDQTARAINDPALALALKRLARHANDPRP